MNSVIVGERWIALQGREGIARAGKINPVEGDCQDWSGFLCCGGFWHYNKGQLMRPGHMLTEGPAGGQKRRQERKSRQKNSI